MVDSKTSDHQSTDLPRFQRDDDSKDISDHQARKIYIQNYYDMSCWDSFNTRNSQVQNCDNSYQRTVIERASDDEHSFDDECNDPTPSTGLDLHSIPTNPLLQTQMFAILSLTSLVVFFCLVYLLIVSHNKY